MFCHVLLFFFGVPGISTTPRIIYPLEKSHRMAFNLALSWKCSQPFMCPSISSIFFSARSIWLWLFCPVSGLVGWLWQLRFYSKGSGHLTYHQNNFFPGGNLTEWHSTWLSTWLFPGSAPKMSQPFMFPSISSIFSARSIWLWLLFSCLFCFWAGWVVGCGSYFFIRRVPDISHTPRIISSLVEIPQNGIQHGSSLEVPPKCPNLSCFPLFLPSSQQEAFGCDCFFHVLSCFCAGWVVVAATFLFEGFRTSHIPLE